MDKHNQLVQFLQNLPVPPQPLADQLIRAILTPPGQAARMAQGLQFDAGTPDLNGVGRQWGVSGPNGNNIGAYTEPGLFSVGGSLFGPNGVGGTIGYDMNGGLFGSAHFGKQGY